jgi:hypothetical protein
MGVDAASRLPKRLMTRSASRVVDQVSSGATLTPVCASTAASDEGRRSRCSRGPIRAAALAAVQEGDQRGDVALHRKTGQRWEPLELPPTAVPVRDGFLPPQ